MALSIEGYSLDELAALPVEELDALVPDDVPVVLRVGTAEALVQVRRRARRLIVEVAHVDGGGEGALPKLVALVLGHAARRGSLEVEWLVHATRCAQPNERLRRLLARRGFEPADGPSGPVLRRLQAIPDR